MEERPLISKMRENFLFFSGMSFLYGILFTFCMYQNVNGITFPFIVLITIVFGVKYIKKIGFQIQKDTWLYVGGMLLLGISSSMTASGFFIFFNLIGIFLLFIAMMVHQFYRDQEWWFQTYVQNFFLLIGTTISGIRYPFQHAAKNVVGKSTDKKKNAVYIFIGVGIAFLLLIIIFPLLIHSDRIFEMYFGSFIKNIHLGDLFWMFIMAVIMSILCYAFFGALCEYNLKKNTEQRKNGCNPIIGITFTSILAFIYLLYSGIQIIFLFIRMERGLPGNITYSAYARSGFWELLIISIINFVLVLICAYLFEENRVLKILLTVISFCTFVMIFSSAYRMCMYVKIFHLTFLRILVLWFLFLLALIMGGTVLNIYKKKFPLFRYIMLVTACCYILFSLSKPDYWIAKYNVAHMDKIEWQDLNYFLYGLSEDASSVIAEIDIRERMVYGYEDDAEETIETYFKGIQIKYDRKDIRKINYSHMQALKAAKQYMKRSR